jgi:hypothetical protein
MVAAVLAQASVQAATLIGNVNTAPASSVNLTTDGTLDWSIWNTTSATGVASPVAPTNKMASSPGIISTVGSISGGTLRGSAITSTETFSYSNGTSPTTLSPAVTQGSIFESAVGSAGKGLTLTLQGDTNALRAVDIWATGFDGTGTMTATLNGTTPVVLMSQAYGVNSLEAPTLFTLTYQTNSNSDVLNISYNLTNTGTNTGSSHVSIQAVAVSLAAVPEPSQVMLGMFGLVALMMRRRRREVFYARRSS